MVTTLLYVGFFLLAGLVPMWKYIVWLRKRDAEALAAAERGKLHSSGPRAQFPLIDITYCIGCGNCADVCPEGDVIVMIAGKAAFVNGHKCIGHGMCADVCPVGAITMVTSKGQVTADMPQLTEEFETNIPGMFIAGELGGLALIKNAVNEGRDCIDFITKRLPALRAAKAGPEVVDVCVVGAGPAGISASLRAIQNKLTYVTLEREKMGGTVEKYPRQKLVMTSPVEFPLHGKFSKLELPKEKLLEFWGKIASTAGFKVNEGEEVKSIQRGEDGIFTIETAKGETTKATYRARTVMLALGRRGTPRKLGVKGEELGKVMYSLLEADHYINSNILIVGGGDSAVEAAMGLAAQVGNKVTLSYRKDAFARIKERNTQRITECMKTGKVNVVFESAPTEITEKTVMLEVKGDVKEMPNDYVWVFAGGEPPNKFLEKVGIVLGPRDMTQALLNEAKSDGAGQWSAPVPKPAGSGKAARAATPTDAAAPRAEAQPAATSPTAQGSPTKPAPVAAAPSSPAAPPAAKPAAPTASATRPGPPRLSAVPPLPQASPGTPSAPPGPTPARPSLKVVPGTRPLSPPAAAPASAAPATRSAPAAPPVVRQAAAAPVSPVVRQAAAAPVPPVVRQAAAVPAPPPPDRPPMLPKSLMRPAPAPPKPESEPETPPSPPLPRPPLGVISVRK